MADRGFTHGRLARGLAPLVAMATVAGGVLVVSGPSAANVTAVQGSALGYFGDDISLFGGVQEDRGPAPTVTLAPDASNSPQAATSEPTAVFFGPATLFSSGPISVDTGGSTGPAGSVTSTAAIETVNRSGDEVLTADSISSTCTASETGVSGGTTVTNGTVRTHAQGTDLPDHDPANPEGVVNVPTDPAPNTAIAGHLHITATATDFFVLVFNEQVVNPDGSITVNAVHEYFGATLDPDGRIVEHPGSFLQGDLYLGQVVCGVTAVASTTTTTTTTSSTTTTTMAPTTTTMVAPTTTTTTTVPATCSPPDGPLSGLVHAVGTSLRFPVLRELAVLLCRLGL